MEPPGVERRLAAILAADVVGYSRLMEEDELSTRVQLSAHRKELIDPKIAAHRGRIVKLMGDGMLVEFASVVDAVQCAVEIQAAMARRNADVPENRRIVFRVGINLGDIIVEGDDIHGAGVNIAARLEGIAEPGGICVSPKSTRRSAANLASSSTILACSRSRISPNRCGPTASLSVPRRPRARKQSRPGR